MKKILLLLSAVVNYAVLNAQVKEGTITYEQKVNMHRTIQDEQMKAMIPEFNTSKFLLYFSDSVSMYKPVPQDEAPDPFEGGGGRRIVFRFGTGGGDLYKNLAQAKSIQTSEIGGKNFLIVDSIKQSPWKLGTETRQILGYTCHKATRTITMNSPGRRIIMAGNGSGEVTKDSTIAAPKGKEVEVVAWFADDIISPVGPENYGQLPGVILQLDVDNGATVFNATEVKKTVDVKELKEPKKGKVVTRQEFTKMMSEMMSNMGPGGFRIGG